MAPNEHQQFFARGWSICSGLPWSISTGRRWSVWTGTGGQFAPVLAYKEAFFKLERVRKMGKEFNEGFFDAPRSVKQAQELAINQFENPELRLSIEQALQANNNKPFDNIKKHISFSL